MAVHKAYVEWHDLIENQDDFPRTDDPVYAIVEQNFSRYVDTMNFRCVNGAWEVAVPPSEDDLDPDEYDPIETYPGLKVIAWCKPLLPTWL